MKRIFLLSVSERNKNGEKRQETKGKKRLVVSNREILRGTQFLGKNRGRTKIGWN